MSKRKGLEAIAAQDARDYGLAQMFFGEGAGTRRKLIGAAVDQKYLTVPGYAEAFDRAFAGLDQLELAETALRERKRIDRATKAGKNLRALRSGNAHNMTNGVFLAVGVVYVIHITGYDEVIKREFKEKTRRLRTQLRNFPIT